MKGITDKQAENIGGGMMFAGLIGIGVVVGQWGWLPLLVYISIIALVLGILIVPNK